MALPHSMSDHSLILMMPSLLMGGPRSFKFEEMWLLYPDFLEVVEKEWNCVNFDGSTSRNFALKLKGLKARLKVWNKDSANSLKVEIEGCLDCIRLLDLAKEEGSLSWDERVDRDLLRKKF